jgi:cytidylate kinase
MTTIALSVAPGTASREFTSALARSLDLELVDLRPFEHDMARRSDAAPGVLKRFIHAKSSTRWNISREQLARRMHEETLEIAASGDVLIVGWSAPVILRPFTHVARVGVGGAMAFRERTIMATYAYRDVRTARFEIESEDAMLARWLSLTFGAEAHDASLYNLVVDAESVSCEACSDLLRLLVSAPRFKATPHDKSTISQRLADMQREEGRSSLAGTGPGAAVVIDSTTVSLSGVQSHEDAIAKIEQRLHGAGPVPRRIDPLSSRAPTFEPPAELIKAETNCPTRSPTTGSGPARPTG